MKNIIKIVVIEIEKRDEAVNTFQRFRVMVKINKSSTKSNLTNDGKDTVSKSNNNENNT